MTRTILAQGLLDDGTPLAPGVAPFPHDPISLTWGETVTVHLVVKNPSGRQVRATNSLVASFAARRKPAPQGQLFYRRMGVPANDGGWDFELVPQDYKLIFEGAGRFVQDTWLLDQTDINNPKWNPVRGLGALVVLETAQLQQEPITSPTPQQIVAFGLPNPTPAGAVLVAQPGNQVAWSLLPLRNFFRATFANQFTAAVDYSSLGLLVPPTRVLAAMPVTDSLLGVECQVEQSSITNTGCVIRSNSNGWSGFVDAEVIA